jgi:hypothetical protein
MKKRLILLTLILTLNFINVFADMRPPNSPSPLKEEKQAGFCFVPTVIVGTILLLSIITFGRWYAKRSPGASDKNSHN